MIDLICWHNGTYKNLRDVHISPLDFGFIHSEATYDVMRAIDQKILFENYHVTRFANSCNYFGFTLDFEISKVATELLSKNNLTDAFVWVIAWRGIPPSGSPRDVNGPQHSLIYVKPYYKISNDPITMCIDQTNRRTPDSCVNQEYKNFGWIEFNQSQKRAVSQNFDSVLLLSVDGYITEGPGFGVCFVKDNTVITPQKDCLRSVTIKVVEDICEQHNIKFLRKDISVSEAYAATECFICSTSGGITFVDKLDDIQFTHSMSSIIKEYYEDL